MYLLVVAIILYLQENEYTVTLDLHFNSTASRAKTESFLVSVRYSPHSSTMIQLLSFERTSLYGIYRACSDSNEVLPLCICESDRKYHLNAASNFIQYNRISNIVSDTVITKLSKCVYVIQYNITAEDNSKNHGFSVYLANVCDNHFTVLIDVNEETEVVFSSAPQDGVRLHAADVQFALVVYLTTADSAHTSVMRIFSFTIHS